MNDREALALMRLLAQYGAAYSPDLPPSVVDVADDLVTSSELTGRERAEIETLLDTIRAAWGA